MSKRESRRVPGAELLPGSWGMLSRKGERKLTTAAYKLLRQLTIHKEAERATEARVSQELVAFLELWLRMAGHVDYGDAHYGRVPIEIETFHDRVWRDTFEGAGGEQVARAWEKNLAEAKRLVKSRSERLQ